MYNLGGGGVNFNNQNRSPLEFIRSGITNNYISLNVILKIAHVLKKGILK
jgi:hypothetical protein